MKAAGSAKPAVESAKPAVESMTGFGESRATIDGKTLICRVRSLNHRFLDLKVRLPRSDWLGLDLAIRKSTTETFKRGAVELTITTESSRESTENVINTKAAKAYWSELTRLSKSLKSKAAAPSLEALLRLPGVVGGTATDNALVAIDEGEVLKKLVVPALAALKKARRSEGEKLSKHILEMITQMQKHVEQIAALEGPEKEKARQAITDRANETLKLLRQIGANSTTDTRGTDEFAGRLREEAVFWIERRDFDEERMRLSMNLKNFRDLISSHDEVSGRKLEFVQQEILREINTLGTKAHSPPITEHTIELKTILERIREQLANVE